MISDGLQDYDLILASASPRRRQLMEEAGFSFRTGVIDYDEENWPAHLRGSEIAEYLATGKSGAWKEKILPRQIVITADTIVWCHETVLGKPADDSQAMQFLRLLSGCRHEVITGLCLRDCTRSHTFSVTTNVTFKELDEDEISYYVRHYRPLDKAGAYGIQEWIGLRGIRRIEGSYYNVVGMPVSDLYDALLHFTGNKSRKL
jgi:septum formation protein